MTGWPDPERPGVPLNPERSAAHVLRFPPDERDVRSEAQAWWMATRKVWLLRGGASVKPEAMVGVTDYLGPCLTPSEVAAQLAAARREAFEEAARVCEERAQQLAVLLPQEGQTDELGARAAIAALETTAAAIRALAVEGESDV